MTLATPLIDRHLDDVFCRFFERSQYTPISVNVFLSHVQSVASALPSAQHAINLCTNRYYFAVTFCAIIVRGQTNLLPPNKNPQTQQLMHERYAGVYIVYDEPIDIAPELEAIELPDLAMQTDGATYQTIPLIKQDHVAAISFTSGSTGHSKPNVKTWLSIRVGASINAPYFAHGLAQTSILATVPAQHMWGLETTIMLPLFAPVSISSGQPLFPQDVATQLSALPEPRLLVSTPVHLRYLQKSQLSIPKVERILCATSPLSPALAQSIEALSQGTLTEIFGCSEIGSMASRQPATQSTWQLFEGLDYQVLTNGSTEIMASHLPVDRVVLQDRLTFSAKGQFTLVGRHNDQINIAGKRGSIAEITRLLLDHDDIQDAALLRIGSDQSVDRLVGFVVSSVARAELVRYLRAYLDPVFVPKTLYFVEQLPRETNSKLSQQSLQCLYEQLSA